MINTKVEIPKISWAQSMINNIIWGDSQFNPNKEKEELVNEANRLTVNSD